METENTQELPTKYLIHKSNPPICNLCNQLIPTFYLLYECKIHSQKSEYELHSEALLTLKKHIKNTLNYLKKNQLPNKLEQNNLRNNCINPTANDLALDATINPKKKRKKQRVCKFNIKTMSRWHEDRCGFNIASDTRVSDK